MQVSCKLQLKTFITYIYYNMQLLRDKKRVAKNPTKENYISWNYNKSKKIKQLKRDIPDKNYINVNWQYIDEESFYK